MLGRDGTLWMASASGLSRLKNASVRNYGRPEGLRSAMVWGTLDDRRGGRYVAFNGEGLAHVDVTGQARHFGAPNGPPGAGIVISMAHDGDDLLLATFSGLYRFHDGRFTREPAVPADRVHAIHVLAQDDVLLGMHGGLWRLRGQRLARIPSSLREPVLRMRTEADGSLLVAAGRDGAWRLQGDRMSALASRPGTEVRDVFRASDGRIYAAGLGLFVIDRGRLLPLLPINQAQVGQMHAITESADRKLWINSNLGVIRVALDQVDAWLLAETEALATPLIASLMLGNLLREALVEDGQGRFAGATQAVTAGVRRLQVEYTVASPAWADALGFEYRLLPLDRDWVDNGSLRSIAMGRYIQNGCYWRILCGLSDCIYHFT